MKYVIALLAFANCAYAHEMTPTYPKMDSSYIDDVFVTTMKLWNRREDVSYYELNVFTDQWDPIPFATPERIVKVGYLEHKSIELYIHRKHAKRAEFICSTSKLLREDVKSSGVTSRVCSRIK